MYVSMKREETPENNMMWFWHFFITVLKPASYIGFNKEINVHWVKGPIILSTKQQTIVVLVVVLFVVF